MRRLAVFVIAVISVFACAICTVACSSRSDSVSNGGDGKPDHTHEFVDYVYNNDATCIKDGTETAKCTGCDETDTRASAAHPATGEHTFTTYVYNNDVTCVDDGTETATCENCTATDTRKCTAHPATGHEFVGYVCEICGEYKSDVPVTQGLEFSEIKDSNDEVIGYNIKSIGSVTDNEIIIPNSHNGKPVTSIGNNAFNGCDHLTSIMIQDGVTHIGSGAFADCFDLTSIVIPNSVTSIGERAFYGCSSLASIEIPNSVTSIGRGAFSEPQQNTYIV